MAKVYKVIAVLLITLSLCACGDEKESEAGTAGVQEATGQTATAPASTPSPEGNVYWLSSNTEADQVLQLLAQRYYDETGKIVEIITVAESTYSTILDEQLSYNEGAPSLFEIKGWEEARRRENQLYDIKESGIASELTTDMFTLTEGEKILALPCSIDSFGIIVNTGLLSRAGYSLADIQDYESLKKISEQIHENAYHIGFDAFTSSPLNEESRQKYVAQTANVALYYESADMGTWSETPATISGQYLQNYKNLWDLYMKNSPYNAQTFTTVDYDPIDEFGNYKAAFYQGTSDDYDTLVNLYGMYDGELAMIPFYSSNAGGENLGLSCGCKRYWVINKNAKQEDLEATIDFLNWMVTSPAATDLLSKAFGALPYKSAKNPVNIFEAQALGDIKEGKTIPNEAYLHIPNIDVWTADLVTSLEQYNYSPTDQNWDLVKQTFVDGWLRHFTTVNG